MKIYKIRSGKLKADTGNFTGFTLKKEKVHISKAMIGDLLDTASVDADGRVTGLSLWVIGQNEMRQFNDEDGNLEEDDNGDPVLRPRLEAVMVSDDHDAIIDAYNEEAESDLTAASKLQKKATALGLTASSLKTLLRSSVEA